VVNKLNNNDAAFTAGGLLGYNYQMDKLVLGVETDFNYLGFSDSSKSTAAEQDVTITTSSNLDANWFGTIRGRLGFALDNVLIYGTGGAAYGDIEGKGKVFATDGVQSATWKGSDNNVKWGWTVGGGAEYGIDNWSLGLEYLYVDLGSGNWSDTIATSQLKGDANYAFSTVRATVKYRFQ
jgi:outer membrane immunogenic protein